MRIFLPPHPRGTSLSPATADCRHHLSVSIMRFRRGATMENLPDVVLSNIFIRLLAKQLAQMKCVSKSWNALLSEPSFVKSHLKRSIKNNKDDGIFLVFANLFSFGSNPFTSHLSQSPHLGLNNIMKLPVNPQSNNRHGEVIGSVNGLICFQYGSNHDSENVLYIWNPSLSALLTLPPSHSVGKYMRFGFDPETDDYKVVKFTRRIGKWSRVEVYSMRKGSWKLITQEIPSHVKDVFGYDVLCVDGHDGRLHWIAEINHSWNSVDTILVFDLGTETFREIPLPDSVTSFILDGNANDVSMDLAILGVKLCVMTKSFPNYEYEVWVMEEYGVGESWVKQHDFPLFSGNLVTYGFTSRNELFIKVESRGLALYDPVAAKTKIFKYCGEHFYALDKVVDYVDSLVWVTPAEQREMNCCGISRFQF